MYPFRLAALAAALFVSPALVAVPARVVDLRIDAVTNDAIAVELTVPAPTAGKTLTEYDLRLHLVTTSTPNITTLNFNSRQAVVGEPVPGTPGTKQTILVSSAGIAQVTKYQLALKTRDTGSTTWSTMSNVVTVITRSATPEVGAQWRIVDPTADYTVIYWGHTQGGPYPNMFVTAGNVSSARIPVDSWWDPVYAIARSVRIDGVESFVPSVEGVMIPAMSGIP